MRVGLDTKSNLSKCSISARHIRQTIYLSLEHAAQQTAARSLRAAAVAIVLRRVCAGLRRNSSERHTFETAPLLRNV